MGITAAEPGIDLRDIIRSVNLKNIDVNHAGKSAVFRKFFQHFKKSGILYRHGLIRFPGAHFDFFLYKNRGTFMGKHIHVNICSVFGAVHKLLNHQVVIAGKQHFDFFPAAYLIDVDTGASLYRLYKNGIGNFSLLHSFVESFLVYITLSGRNVHFLEKFIHSVFVKAGFHHLIRRYNGGGAYRQKAFSFLCQKT